MSGPTDWILRYIKTYLYPFDIDRDLIQWSGGYSCVDVEVAVWM